MLFFQNSYTTFKNMAKNLLISVLSLYLMALLPACESTEALKPNFILIYCDDLGYGDLGCFGSTVHRTPNIDRMAEEGMRFTDFYVTSGVCTPSRASLLTGCYPRRVEMHVNARPEGSIGRQVLFPKAQKGLNPDEVTIAEILQHEGYVTACIGKWHLGDQQVFLPTRQGFDYYYGIPYSNDMDRDFCPLPLMRDEEVIEAPVDQFTITQRYTEEVLRFIKDHKNNSFFIYLPHAMVHNPVHAGKSFQGKSANGGYGDATEEVDWSTGRILDCIRENGLAENTLVIFTSDNGAAERWGGSNLPLSGWKGSTMEGGMRVPAIFWWPGNVPAGSTCNALSSTLDVLPTFSKMAGGSLPADRIIDGHDIKSLITGRQKESPYDAFYYYQLEQLQAVRSGEWKLFLQLDSNYQNIHRGTWRPGYPLRLFNLDDDVAETENLAEQHPEVVRELLNLAEVAREDLGDLHKPGRNIRPAGLVEDPVPQLMH